MATELWPDFKIETKPRGVRAVLEEAGQELKGKTGGLVELRVFLHSIEQGNLPTALYRGDLYVPKIDYTFSGFVIGKAPLTGFPVAVWTTLGDASGLSGTAANEDELRGILSEIFHSERTQLVVQNLISMATD